MPWRRGDKSVRTKLQKEMRDRKATEHGTRMRISKVGFERLVKDMLMDLGQDHLKVKDQAMRAFQTATETLMRRRSKTPTCSVGVLAESRFPNDMEACLVLCAREPDALAEAGLRVLQAPFRAHDAEEQTCSCSSRVGGTHVLRV